MNLGMNSTSSQNICFLDKGRNEATVNCGKLCMEQKSRVKNDNLGVNGEVFERSEGVFFSFFLHVLEIK